MMFETYLQAVAAAPHLLAMGVKFASVMRDDTFPLDKVMRVETGNCFPFNVPVDIKLIVEVDGLTVTGSFDLEPRGSNGSGTLHVHDRLHELMSKLPEAARLSLKAILKTQFLPAMEERRAEAEQYFAKQTAQVAAIKSLIA